MRRSSWPGLLGSSRPPRDPVSKNKLSASMCTHVYTHTHTLNRSTPEPPPPRPMIPTRAPGSSGLWGSNALLGTEAIWRYLESLGRHRQTEAPGLQPSGAVGILILELISLFSKELALGWDVGTLALASGSRGQKDEGCIRSLRSRPTLRLWSWWPGTGQCLLEAIDFHLPQLLRGVVVETRSKRSA